MAEVLVYPIPLILGVALGVAIGLLIAKLTGIN